MRGGRKGLPQHTAQTTHQHLHLGSPPLLPGPLQMSFSSRGPEGSRHLGYGTAKRKACHFRGAPGEVFLPPCFTTFDGPPPPLLQGAASLPRHHEQNQQSRAANQSRLQLRPNSPPAVPDPGAAGAAAHDQGAREGHCRRAGRGPAQGALPLPRAPKPSPTQGGPLGARLRWGQGEQGWTGMGTVAACL